MVASVVAELEPELDLDTLLLFDELDTSVVVGGLVVGWYWSAEELDVDVDVLEELMSEEGDPLELVEASKDTLTDASVEDEDTSVAAVDELPGLELEKGDGALEFDDGDTESISVARVADGVVSELEDASSEKDEAPAATDPELEVDERRALVLATAAARSRSWKTFMGVN
ncbi:uncharacterized protein IUM83_14799 [Phytophthora cinnamomi]|uniref:uncharacterized protein n=1 Tax=Phytophthora cinnamomi TaxID=4785 RepID=UPI00355A410A|nr:hypothetical protein IUM83_14799 [Phytophthora cinnamomi]